MNQLTAFILWPSQFSFLLRILRHLHSPLSLQKCTINPTQESPLGEEKAMRPASSSSTSTNTAYRAEPPFFIDFFAKEKEENTATAQQQSQFGHLEARSMPSHLPLEASATVAPSSHPQRGIAAIRTYLFQMGYGNNDFLMDATIQNRLDSTHLSPETLLTALQIMHDVTQPVFANLAVVERERQKIIAKLIGIVNLSSGFCPSLKNAACNSGGNPVRLIEEILQQMRFTKQKKANARSRAAT